MDKYAEIFIKNFDTALERAGLNQTQFCLKYGFPRNKISKIRNGYGKALNLTTLREIEECLGLASGSLLRPQVTDSGTPSPTPQESLDDLSRRIHSEGGALLLAQLLFPGITPEAVEQLRSLRAAGEWRAAVNFLQLIREIESMYSRGELTEERIRHLMTLFQQKADSASRNKG